MPANTRSRSVRPWLGVRPGLAWLVGCWLFASCPVAAAGVASEKDLVEEDEYVLRLSLPTESDFAAWRSPGLRVQLGYAFARFFGDPPRTSFWGHHILFRPLVRLDEQWSLALSCDYTIASGNLDGLRWSVGIEPIWHPLAGLGISLGLGYAGILGSTRRPQRRSSPTWTSPAPVHSRDASANESLSECQGAGWNALARVEYLFVAGPLFATGPFLQGDSQSVRCAANFEMANPDTGRRVQVFQPWRHHGLSLGWWCAWR